MSCHLSTGSGTTCTRTKGSDPELGSYAASAARNWYSTCIMSDGLSADVHAAQAVKQGYNSASQLLASAMLSNEQVQVRHMPGTSSMPSSSGWP